jgi:hypothetical protein
VAGHVTERMWSKYSQVRMDSVREKLMEAFKTSSSLSASSRVVAFPGNPVSV